MSPIEKTTTSTSTHEGQIIAHFGKHLIVEDGQNHLVHCTARRQLPTLVTGDRVNWEPISHCTGIVTGLLPRKSVITRFDKRLQNKPIVANVDQLVIVVALKPTISETTIDRYLIIAEHFNLPVIIVVNKWDLKEDDDYALNKQRIERYSHIGTKLFFISVKSHYGLNDLVNQLKGKTNLLAGQSGVGKSSLINHLIPNVKTRTQELSQYRNLGKHTTSASQLYHMPPNGDLIDSPGIRQFYLNHLNQNEIEHGFIEFRPFLGQCQFRDCSHDHEPGCALHIAVEKKLIQPFRLDNYHTIISEIKRFSG